MTVSGSLSRPSAASLQITPLANQRAVAEFSDRLYRCVEVHAPEPRLVNGARGLDGVH